MKEQFYYFSGTHWDREWYQTFQGFRLKLIKVVNDLIDYLENHTDIQCFHFDGQTIVLDDYLEICPENRERLQKLIQQKRIRIGPWYCIPDENLVSGEALIRNLQKGIQKCSQWGTEFWPVGDLCDTFGHTPQMPQLLNGFGIQSAILGRGTNESTTPAYFRWMAPNGGEVLTFKVPDACGYGSFALEVCGQVQKGELRSPESPEFRAALSKYLRREKERSNLPVTVIWDGMDHEPMHTSIPAYLDAVAELYPDAAVVQGDLSDVARQLEPERSRLPVRTGELLETAQKPGPYLHLLSHVLSSRQSIKNRNDSCQNLLEKLLEPMLVYFGEHGIQYPGEILQNAWQHLLQNHPHDSICGCSIDRVHDEMSYRFSQVESITEAVLDDGIRTLAGGVHPIREEGGTLALINPMPCERRGLVEAELPFDPNYPKWNEPFGYQSICAFRLIDSNGNQVPYSIQSIQEGAQIRLCSEAVSRVDLYRILIPAFFDGMGSISLRIEPAGAPVRNMGRIAYPDGRLENEFLTVEVQADGRISLYDKAAGRTYSNLLGLSDHGELGDGWNSVYPVEDEEILGGAVKRVAVKNNDGLCGRITVEMELRLPEGIEYVQGRLRRSSSLKAVPVCFSYTLQKGERKLLVDLDVDNAVKDHVLRLLLPTGIPGNYQANAAFTFVERKTGIDPGTAGWKECGKLEKPTAGIVLKRDAAGNGLAFISRGGLHECGGDDDPSGTLKVTLLRSFSKTPTTNGEPGGQELFPHHYSFELMPLDSSVSNTMLQYEQNILQSPALSFTARRWEDDTLLTVKGGSVSALAPSERGFCLRIYNPEDRENDCVIYWRGRNLRQIETCTLNNETLGQMPFSAGSQEISLRLQKQQILTLQFIFQ